MSIDRTLAIQGIGKSVALHFSLGDMDTAWLWESWRIKLENMTDEEFDRQYGITEDAGSIS